MGKGDAPACAGVLYYAEQLPMRYCIQASLQAPSINSPPLYCLCLTWQTVADCCHLCFRLPSASLLYVLRLSEGDIPLRPRQLGGNA